jgi:hypothetical protein
MSAATITKSVTLQPNWKDNDNQGFKDYLDEVFKVNESVSSLFDDENVDVKTMTILMTIQVDDLSFANEVPLIPINILTSEVIDILEGNQGEPVTLTSTPVELV